MFGRFSSQLRQIPMKSISLNTNVLSRHISLNSVQSGAKVVGTAIVKPGATKGKRLIPTRAALSLVSQIRLNI